MPYAGNLGGSVSGALSAGRGLRSLLGIVLLMIAGAHQWMRSLLGVYTWAAGD